MAIASPPRPPSQDELDALIPEARDRQRRRRLSAAAVLALATGVGLALWVVFHGGGTVSVRDHRPMSVTAGHVSSTSKVRRGIGDIGSSGGVTWAINGHGIWLTTNSGRTWRKASLPNLAVSGVAGSRADPLANIRDVQFADRLHGWVSTTDGPRIYRTTDGGRNWRAAIPPGCGGVCVGGTIDFFDTHHGYALLATMASENRFFRTEDGGRTWQLVSRATVHGEITFVDHRAGFAFGGPGLVVQGFYQGPEFGHLYRTTDGGTTWSPYDIGDASRFIEQPSAFGRDAVVVQNGPNPADGWNLAPGTVYASDDSGHDWSGRRVPAGLGVPPSFDAASPNLWAWPSRTALFTTGDAGRHWRKIVLHGLTRNAAIRKVDLTSRRVGWAIISGLGPHSTLFHTSDGGLRWTPAGPLKPRRHTPTKH